MAEDNTKSLDRYISLGIICGIPLIYGIVIYYAKPLVIKYMGIGMLAYGCIGLIENHLRDNLSKSNELNKF